MPDPWEFAFCAGVALVAVGIGLMHIPAALIFLGVSVTAVAFLQHKGR